MNRYAKLQKNEISQIEQEIFLFQSNFMIKITKQFKKRFQDSTWSDNMSGAKDAGMYGIFISRGDDWSEVRGEEEYDPNISGMEAKTS